jgi:hypothetical protein
LLFDVLYLRQHALGIPRVARQHHGSQDQLCLLVDGDPCLVANKPLAGALPPVPLLGIGGRRDPVFGGAILDLGR